MLKTIDNGFTIYIEKTENGLICSGLKSLGNGRGMDLVELHENELLILEQFSHILKLLDDGEILQIYKDYQFPNICYTAQVGKIVQEGPYAETDCLEVKFEGEGNYLYDALMVLEKFASKLDKSTNAESLKKVYRPYGMDKYVTCNMNL